MSITILVTDENLTTVGDPIAEWTSLDCITRFNRPGSGEIVVPAWPWVMDLLDPSNRIVVIRNGSIFCAGPIELADFKWSLSDSEINPGVVKVNFAEDLALIAGRVTYPNPALAATDDLQPDRYTVTATNAETVLRNLVNLNAGPGAITVREIPALALGSLASVGTSVNFSTRFEPLADALRSVAVAGGGLGFRTRQDGAQIKFEVYAPADKSSGVGAIRFSRGLGNLRSIGYTRVGPTVTAAIVGGGGEGAAREIRERLNSAGVAAWWRLEQFVDQRSTNDDVELDQAGDEALATGAETAQLVTETVETDDQRFGVHFGLGDKVAVEPVPGVQVNDIVQSAHLKATAKQGDTVSVLVGSPDASPDPKWVQELRAIDRRLGRLEAR